MLTVKEIAEKVSKIGKKYGVKSAYLFGSYARGEADVASDVDIIIERGNVKTYDAYFNLYTELSDELGVKVDLLSADSVKPSFLELIKQDRVLIYGA